MVQYTITTRVDGDVLKVFWSYCSEVGFVKVPRNNKRCIWVRGFLLAYIPIQFLECLVCVGLRGNVYSCDSKMAQSMAVVLRAPRKLCSFSYVLFVILLFYVMDIVSITVYDRHMLLNIGSFIAQRKLDFEFLNAGALFTDTASAPFLWAARPRPRKRRRKRGKRAGVLVRLRCRPLRPFCWLTFSHWTTNSANCGRVSHTNEKQGTAALFASQKHGCLQWFQTQPSILRGSLCTARTERKSSQGKAEVGAFVSLSTTHGVMKGICTLLNPSAPLIWNFICFCVDHSGYRGNLQRS